MVSQWRQHWRVQHTWNRSLCSLSWGSKPCSWGWLWVLRGLEGRNYVTGNLHVGSLGCSCDDKLYQNPKLSKGSWLQQTVFSYRCRQCIDRWAWKGILPSAVQGWKTQPLITGCMSPLFCFHFCISVCPVRPCGSSRRSEASLTLRSFSRTEVVRNKWRAYLADRDFSSVKWLKISKDRLPHKPILFACLLWSS